MLTTIAIEKLPIPAKRREVPDEKITGLYLVIQPSGAKSWALRYRFGGKPAKLTIGPFPTVDLRTARQRAQEALGVLAGGKARQELSGPPKKLRGPPQTSLRPSPRSSSSGTSSATSGRRGDARSSVCSRSRFCHRSARSASAT
jgi:hypothetical protein